MKRDRNTFFGEAQMSTTSIMPNMMPQMPQMPQYGMQAPMQAAQASQSFYAGPTPTMQQPYYGDTGQHSELESRIAKLERNMQRLEARVGKLESNASLSTNDVTNMYMI